MRLGIGWKGAVGRKNQGSEDDPKGHSVLKFNHLGINHPSKPLNDHTEELGYGNEHRGPGVVAKGDSMLNVSTWVGIDDR